MAIEENEEWVTLIEPPWPTTTEGRGSLPGPVARLMDVSVLWDATPPDTRPLADRIEGLIVEAVEEAAEDYQALDWTPITALIAKLKSELRGES